jgi:glycerol-3-phosphate dehydrogenase
MSNFSREIHLQRLATQEFDLCIIGGGINGAGIARDAAMRGLKVALVEAHDFCSGTSSKSSKMLHGGIRYLEQFHLGLVFEASQERRLHSDLLSPHLATPVPFLIPVYPWSPHSLPMVAMGVFLYDLLALFRNHRSRFYSRDRAMREESFLESKGLKGGVVYHDVVMDDFRIGLENVRSASFHGATTANYTQVRGFEKDGSGKIRGVWVKDVSTPNKNDFLIKAKIFVNATGPWSDYIRKLASPDVEAMLRPTKGVHLILPNHVLGKNHGFLLTAKTDNRVFFSIPWFDRTLVGTTDTDYNPAKDGSLDDIQANQNDVDYLMESIKRTFPGSSVGISDVQSTFAGLRPLVSEGKSHDPSAVSREHRIWQDSNGLFNIAGGKYTTYRTMSAELIDYVVKKMGSDFRWEMKPIATQGEALVLSENTKKEDFGKLMEEYAGVLGTDTVRHLQLRYGARWQRVADLAMSDATLRERIVPSELDIMAEVNYSKEHEMAVDVSDFLRRRTMLALKAPLLDHLERVALVCKIFGKPALTKEQVAKIQGLHFR